jgi:Ran GTPase-activating protein (RanGAP) involved in mRNA processing and transport
MKRSTVIAKTYNHSCVQHRAKVNSDLYAHLCGFKNVEDLLELDLSKNYVGNEAGFDCIIELVKAAPQLKSLNLSDTGMTTENVTELVALLLKHPNLTSLKVNLNRLYIDAGQQLVRLARFNPQITSIEAVDAQPANDVERQLANHIPPKFIAEMQRHLRFNKERLAKASASGQLGAGSSGAIAAGKKSQQQNGLNEGEEM